MKSTKVQTLGADMHHNLHLINTLHAEIKVSVLGHTYFVYYKLSIEAYSTVLPCWSKGEAFGY